MTEMTKKGNKVYELTHKFKLSSRVSEWVKSSDFTTEDIPDTEFNIFAQINHLKIINIQIRKSDPRPAVAVIKVKVSEQKPIIIRTVDWKQNVDFFNWVLSFAYDTCTKDRKTPAKCSSWESHRYNITVDCSIFWHGFVEDLYCSDICQHVNDYWNNIEFTDIKIKVGNSEFSAHKIILAEQSPVFHEMLKTKDVEKSADNSISLLDADVDTIKEMLLFFYQNKLDKAEREEEMLLKLFEFAIKYKIDKLKIACEYILIKDLKLDNVLSRYTLDESYKAFALKEHAIIFFKNEVPVIREDLKKITKQGRIDFTFNHIFKLSHLLNSATFSTADIPNTEFIISAENWKNKLNLKIEKSDVRPGVAIIKVQVANQGPVFQHVNDWRKDVDFKELFFSVSLDVCKKNSSQPAQCDTTYYHEYEIPISCSIIWQGYLKDFYYPNVCTHLKNYYKNTEFSNVKIKVGDCEFPAHKDILAKQSIVFHTMLTSDMKEARENEISFPDADVDTIKEMLMFFYEKKLDQAEKDEEIALKLFKFAFMYQIEKLKTACECILITNLRIDNVISLYIVGKEHNSIIIQEHAITFLENNVSEMLEKIREEKSDEIDKIAG